MDTHKYFGNLISNHRFVFQGPDGGPKDIPKAISELAQNATEMHEAEWKKEKDAAAQKPETSSELFAKKTKETQAAGRQAEQLAQKKIRKPAFKPQMEFTLAEVDAANKATEKPQIKLPTQYVTAEMPKGERHAAREQAVQQAAQEMKPEAAKEVALNSRQRTIFDAIASLDRASLQKFVEKIDVNFTTANQIGIRLDQGEGFGAKSTKADVAKILSEGTKTENLLEALRPRVISTLVKELNSITSRNDVKAIAEKYGVSGFFGFGGTAEISKALDTYDTDRSGTLKKVGEIIARRGDEDKLSKLMKLT